MNCEWGCFHNSALSAQQKRSCTPQLAPWGSCPIYWGSVDVFPSDRSRCSIPLSVVHTNLQRKQLTSCHIRMLFGSEPGFPCILIWTHVSEPAYSREELSFHDPGWCLIKSGRCEARKTSENRESLRKPSSWAKLSPPFPIPSSCHGDDDVPEVKDNHCPGTCSALFELPHSPVSSTSQFQSAAFLSRLTTCKLKKHWRITIISSSFSIIPCWRSCIYSEAGEKRLETFKHNYHSCEYNTNYLVIHMIFSLHTTNVQGHKEMGEQF